MWSRLRYGVKWCWSKLWNTSKSVSIKAFLCDFMTKVVYVFSVNKLEFWVNWKFLCRHPEILTFKISKQPRGPTLRKLKDLKEHVNIEKEGSAKKG